MFFLREEVIDVFHNKFYIPTIDDLTINIAYIRIISSMECGNTINDSFRENLRKAFKAK